VRCAAARPRAGGLMLFRLFTLLAVAALAVSTWILSSPGTPSTGNEDQGRQLPGYFLNHAVMTDYDENGLPGVRIEAERIDQVANGSDIAMRDVKVNYQPENAEAWVMFGDTAQVEPGTKLIKVRGNVKLMGDPTVIGRTYSTPVIRSDALDYSVNDSVATTPGDVRLEFGKNTVAGHGLKANMKEQTLRLESKVNARFFP
jgi:LPS export ABC transporter protein LptC